MNLIVTLALAAVHVVAGKLRFLDATPRSIWLSTAGGVSVAYVFLHILPDLAEGQEQFHRMGTGWLTSVERHVWLLSLAGLGVFYGLERMVRESQRRTGGGDEEGSTEPQVFWLHTGSFAIYNLLFGYLLASREAGRELAFFGVAIGLHFLVNDFGLRQDHRKAWDRIARWVLAVALICGWGLGKAVSIHPLAVTAVFAFLAGGIVLNVLKEELPQERQSRFWAFALGAAAYGAVLLAGGA